MNYNHKPNNNKKWFLVVLLLISLTVISIGSYMVIQSVSDTSSPQASFVAPGSGKTSIEELEKQNVVPSSESVEEPLITRDDGAPINYESDENSLPIGWNQDTDFDQMMDGISYGDPLENNASINWESMGPSTLRIPEIGLSIPVVPKGHFQSASHPGFEELEMPVSFQAAVDTTTAPIASKEGKTLIAGHINWPDGSMAPMSRTYLAKEGMIIYLTDENGNLTKWRVNGSSVVGQTQFWMDNEMNNSLDGKRTLYLLTCNWSNLDGAYTNNMVLTAEPIS